MGRDPRAAAELGNAIHEVIQGGPAGLDDRRDAAQLAPHAFRVVYDAIQSALAGVLITDLDGWVSYANPALHHMLGVEAGALAGRAAAEVLGADEVERFSELRALIEVAGGGAQAFTVRRPDGGVVELEVSAAPVRSADGAIVGMVAAFQDVTTRRQLERERESLILKLRAALENVKTLRGLLPICAACKSIRDDRGFWHQVESYLMSHSDVEFTHGICPDCSRRLYGDTLSILDDPDTDGSRRAPAGAGGGGSGTASRAAADGCDGEEREGGFDG